MNNTGLKIPEYYIAINGDGKEQIVKYEKKYLDGNNNFIYEGTYGIFGCHEVYTLEKNMRELTNKEKEYNSKREFWKLPQNFYQSIPEY